MKNKKMDIRPYTKQFYKGNVIYFIFALCETLLGAIGALLVSWLIQQLIDLIGGYETGFIITLKNGTIVESGTFDELIAEKGYFYSLFTISQ